MCNSIPTTRISRRNLKNLTLLAFSFVLLAGCAMGMTQTASQIDKLETVGENARILLMPPDIKYYLITAGGVREPNREWTEAARQNFSIALQEYAARIGTDLVTIDSAADLGDEEERYHRLHSAVGMTIQQNHFGTMSLPSKMLPNKERRFDWSLGPGVSEIGENYDADYCLFVFYRAYQSSGGRIFLSLLASAAYGGFDPGDYQGGFASLVDLKTGDVVWFNTLAGGGVMRDPNGARTAVEGLFTDMPTG